MSVPQTPARSTATTTSPSCAAGGSTSWTSAWPGPVITKARMPPSNTGPHGVRRDAPAWRQPAGIRATM
jgi:hypothetical protein